MSNILRKCEIPRLPCGDFIHEDKAAHAACEMDSIGGAMVQEPLAKAAREEFTFKDDHNTAFRARGLSWPPPLAGTSARFQNMCAGMCNRKMEVAYFLDKTSPMDQSPLFDDINMSLGYTVGNLENTSGCGMMPHVPCLSSKSAIYMRSIDKGEVHHNMLSGFDLMRLIGWDDCMYMGCELPTDEEQQLHTSLAGNAFSGFSCGVFKLAARIAGRLPTSSTAEPAEGVKSPCSNGTLVNDTQVSSSSPELESE